MTTLNLEIESHVFDYLKEASAKKGISVEEYANEALSEKVTSKIPSQEEFDKSAEYILNKNLELYKRLA